MTDETYKLLTRAVAVMNAAERQFTGGAPFRPFEDLRVEIRKALQPEIERRRRAVYLRGRESARAEISAANEEH